MKNLILGDLDKAWKFWMWIMDGNRDFLGWEIGIGWTRARKKMIQKLNAKHSGIEMEYICILSIYMEYYDLPRDSGCMMGYPFISNFGQAMTRPWCGWSTGRAATLWSIDPATEIFKGSYVFQVELSVTNKFVGVLCRTQPHIAQWEFQDPKMEVLYHIRPYFAGIFPYIGLT